MHHLRDTFRVLLPDQQIWAPKTALPPGAFGTVLAGDPERGRFALLVRFPRGFHVPRHTHGALLRVLIVSGSMTLTPANGPPVVVPEGGYVELPAGLWYEAACPAPCTFVVEGDAGFDITYADRVDDPRLEARAS